jgi:IclR family acetate operon transcriptional repressor
VPPIAARRAPAQSTPSAARRAPAKSSPSAAKSAARRTKKAAAPPPADEKRTGAQAVGRALGVLRTFERSRELGITEIAHRTGLNVSTAHRIVQALRADGFLDQDPHSERYRLGLTTAVMGQLALESLGLSIAQPEMDRLSARTGEACNLGVRVGYEVMVVVHVPCAKPLRFEQRPGTRVPMHVSAMGKALLAASESIPDELKPFTKNSITSRRRLLTELENVRELGYAVNDEERDIGVRTISAVVRDAHEQPVAAIALQAPSVRLTDDQIPKLAREVVASAARISRRWHADGPDATR